MLHGIVEQKKSNRQKTQKTTKFEINNNGVSGFNILPACKAHKSVRQQHNKNNKLYYTRL
jgi:hypothetical protein